MFYNNLDPVIFKIGPLEARWYGLVYVIGFLTAYFVLERLRKSYRLELTKEEVESLLLHLILGTVIGGRLFHILFWQPSYYLQNPLQIFAFWHGGMAFHGGLIGSIIAFYYFYAKHKEKINFWRVADALSIPAMLILALGRIANFVNSELYGQVTNVSWCVNFQNAEGCRHPYQIYAALKRLFV